MTHAELPPSIETAIRDKQRSFSLDGDGTRDYLRDVAQHAIEIAPSTDIGEVVAAAYVSVAVEEERHIDDMARRLVAFWRARE